MADVGYMRRQKIDRLQQSADISVQLSKPPSLHGNERACWNSWIAPHNLEGFTLNHGDMLVKNGEWEVAIEVYESAKLINEYDNWPFKTELLARIENAEANVAVFSQTINPMMFNTEYACMASHQE